MLKMGEKSQYIVPIPEFVFWIASFFAMTDNRILVSYLAVISTHSDTPTPCKLQFILSIIDFLYLCGNF
jgi:hypothetical protein